MSGRLADIRIAGGPLRRATDAEVDALEAELGMEMPAGYREYVTRLGHGYLCTLRVIPPTEVLAGLEEHRGMMAVYWFWERGHGSFNHDAALGSAVIADTWQGDRVLVWPGDARRVYLLPRDEALYPWDGDLLELADHLCRLVPDAPPDAARVFVPEPPWPTGPRDRRPPIEPDTPPPDLTRPPSDVLAAYFEELVATLAWAIDAVGGADVLDADVVPQEVLDPVFEALEARFAGIHLRYASRPVALAKRGNTMWTAPAERNRFTIVSEEPAGENRVRIRARQPDGWVLWSTLERGEDGWRVIMEENGYDPDV